MPLPIRRELEPTEHMKNAFVAHALLCVSPDETVREEACGVFFYPDRRFALGYERGTVAQFIAIPNVWEPVHERVDHFAFDYETMARRIAAMYGGEPSGHIQLVHSHLTDDGPSDLDYSTVMALEDGLAHHPLWGVANTHLIWRMQSNVWDVYGKPSFAESNGGLIIG